MQTSALVKPVDPSLVKDRVKAGSAILCNLFDEKKGSLSLSLSLSFSLDVIYE